MSNSLQPYGLYPARLLSMGFSRQEYWSRLPCPPPEDLTDPGMETTSLRSPALAGGFFTTNATWEAPLSILRRENKEHFSYKWENQYIWDKNVGKSWICSNYLFLHKKTTPKLVVSYFIIDYNFVGQKFGPGVLSN